MVHELVHALTPEDTVSCFLRANMFLYAALIYLRKHRLVTTERINLVLLGDSLTLICNSVLFKEYICNDCIHFTII